MSNANPGGFGIYVHWPFCAAKCPYCDFNSHVRHDPIDQSRFVSAYGRELASLAAMQISQPVDSIFFGGGTPSLMTPDTVEGILGILRGHFDWSPSIEITMEANPSSVDAARFAAYAAAGVNRLSLGIQSLDDSQLRFLGRLHNAGEAREAIKIAKDHFARVSFDLIYARPEQDLQSWREELEEAIALSAGHLSLYQLTIEQGTPFFDLQKRGRLTIPEGELAAELFELTRDITAKAGLPAYEISNHAAADEESRHNLVYWRSGTWIGTGPGAHGRQETIEGRLATSCERHPEQWLKLVEEQGHGLVERDLLSIEESGDEALLMGLRLTEGLDLTRFEEISGRPLDPQRIADLMDFGMVEMVSNRHLRATRQGSMVLDAVIADLAA